ncbi:MAG TPA: hypothetical protein VHA37_09390 [Candidatus Saccharimonadales bacterium]|nr:hypothetical protein [Candidatus Saccharimonadales bacterium]
MGAGAALFTTGAAIIVPGSGENLLLNMLLSAGVGLAAWCAVCARALKTARP